MIGQAAGGIARFPDIDHIDMTILTTVANDINPSSSSGKLGSVDIVRSFECLIKHC
jgi:hypothetical protein